MSDHPQPPACEMPAIVRDTMVLALQILEEELGASAGSRATKAWVKAHRVEAHENAPREREA